MKISKKEFFKHGLPYENYDEEENERFLELTTDGHDGHDVYKTAIFEWNDGKFYMFNFYVTADDWATTSFEYDDEVEVFEVEKLQKVIETWGLVKHE